MQIFLVKYDRWFSCVYRRGFRFELDFWVARYLRYLLELTMNFPRLKVKDPLTFNREHPYIKSGYFQWFSPLPAHNEKLLKFQAKTLKFLKTHWIPSPNFASRNLWKPPSLFILDSQTFYLNIGTTTARKTRKLGHPSLIVWLQPFNPPSLEGIVWGNHYPTWKFIFIQKIKYKKF